MGAGFCRLVEQGQPPVMRQLRLLQGFGLRLVEEVGDADYQSRYLRPAGRRLDVNPGERAALAVV